MTFRGTENNQAYVAASTSEGGYIIGGHTRDIPDPEYAIWIIKTDPSMAIEWQRVITTDTAGGYRDQNGPYDVIQTPDGGYLLTASVGPPGQNLVNHWMFKFTSSGDLEWQRAYAIGYMYSPVAMTADGNYLLTGVAMGESTSYSAVLIIAPDGAIAWQKGYGGYNLQGHQVIAAPDGGFVVLGSTNDVIGVVYKCDAEGNIVWQKGIENFNPSRVTQLTTLTAAPGGGYLLTGNLDDESDSIWLIKLAEDGAVAWEKTYNGPGSEIGFGMWVSPEGAIFIDGYASSYPDMHGGKWILMLDGDGRIIWQRAYGGQNLSFTRAVPIQGRGPALVGQIAPEYGVGKMDAWVLVTNPDGSMDGTCPAALGGTTDGSSSDISTTKLPASLHVVEANVPVMETNATVSDGNLHAVDICGP
jgi:hypothetical protein